MKKVLIISYFFPPCHLTGANRVGSWVKYLPQNEIYPIVVSRNWEGNEIDEASRLKDSGIETKHIVNKDSEYYYVPYKSSLRDKAFVKSSNSFFFKVVSKLLTFVGLIFQNLRVQFIPYSNMYFEVRKILKEDKEIGTLVISGNPFEQFFFGYLLKKEFKYLNWIADYRDDWTTNPLYEKSFVSRLLSGYNQIFEKKWVANASKVTTVTEVYRKRLSNLHKRECDLLMNGYNEDLLAIVPTEKQDYFQITYSGTIYPHQDFTSLIAVINKIALEKPTRSFQLTFLGSKGFINNKQRKVIETDTATNFVIVLTERLSWEESIAFAKASDVLMIGAYGDLKGVIPSKIFEYVALEVPIVCYPTDEDIIEEILRKTNTAIICQSDIECYEGLKSIVEKSFFYEPNKNEIIKFSAKQQVSILAKILKE